VQIKTWFVLSIACSFFSSAANAYEYENSYNTEGYDYAPSEFAEPINDPVFAEEDTFVERREPVRYQEYRSPHVVRGHANYASRLPKKIAASGEKVIVINPRSHVWGAYTESGTLIRGGLATSGARWCSDIGRPCRTKSGTFRIYSLGSSDCVSHIYPVGEGGAPMPYCMFFNGGQGIHGSSHLADANLSHGCVRVSVNDAEWIRFQFATRGTKVIIQSY